MLLKDIEGYDGMYAVDEMGNVFSRRRGGLRKMKPAPLKGRDGSSYLVVGLVPKGGKQKTLYVHRLVAEAFIEKPEGANIVNHKDMDKRNNAVSNLEWVTHSFNVQHYTDRTVPPHLKTFSELFFEVRTKQWRDVKYLVIPDEMYSKLGIPVEYKNCMKKTNKTLLEGWQHWCRVLDDITCGEFSGSEIARKHKLSVAAVSRITNKSRGAAVWVVYQKYRKFLDSDYQLPIQCSKYPGILPIKFRDAFDVIKDDWVVAQSLYSDTDTIIAHLLMQGWQKKSMLVS